MTNSSLQAPDGKELDSFAPGVIDKYSAPELDQITAVRSKDLSLKKAEQEWRFEVVRLKLMLDQQDDAEGIVPGTGNAHTSSRFWQGAKAGHFGPRLEDYAKDSNRATVQNWIKANEGAKKLLGAGVKILTPALPLEIAAQRGIALWACQIYESLSDEAREVADFYYEQRGELKADMLKEFRQICDGYAERKNELLQGLADGSIKYPSHMQELMVEWETQRREQLAAQAALDEAAALAAAEKNEAEAAKYDPHVKTESHIGDQEPAEDVTIRRTPSKAWYKSNTGSQKVAEVVGDLAAPLPDLINGLAGLSKQLDDQFVHASTMHNYAEFWAGYDQFFYSTSTTKQKWGSNGRLQRMRKLRALMLEVSSKLDVYIANSTPPEGVEYPTE